MKNKWVKVVLLIMIFIFGAIAPIYLWKLGNVFTYIIRPSIWLILLLIVSLFITKGNKPFSFKGRDTRELAIIGSLIFIILYYCLGLVIGYAKTPFARDLLSIIKNSWGILAFFIPREIIRYKFAKSSNKRNMIKIMTMITIIMVLSEVSYSSYSIVTNNFAGLSEYIIKTFLPSVGLNIFLSYLAMKESYISSLLYILPIKLVEIITPVFPNDVFFLIIIIYTLVPLFTFLKIEDVHTKKHKFGIEFEESIESKILHFIAIIFMLFLMAFTTRMLPFVPTIILSDSMNPSIRRGDMVVIKRISSENININDIIEYKVDNIYIIHRVINIKHTKNGVVYITKGDNNKSRDAKEVVESQITGKVRLIIPYIGFPTIWARDFLKNFRGINIEEGVR